tara:strand:+ start:57 stop:386 length:330 start_codon:yes stop_codon:yes gene_type:complete
MKIFATLYELLHRAIENGYEYDALSVERGHIFTFFGLMFNEMELLNGDTVKRVRQEPNVNLDEIIIPRPRLKRTHVIFPKFKPDLKTFMFVINVRGIIPVQGGFEIDID